MRNVLIPSAVSALLFLGGCETYYYKFTDNQSHKDFYEALQTPPSKLPVSIQLTDPETGATTVTTAYTVTPITAAEYDLHRPKYNAANIRP